ncbi:MAG: DUF63 family protein [Candidatus Nanohalobium sp.]
MLENITDPLLITGLTAAALLYRKITGGEKTPLKLYLASTPFIAATGITSAQATTKLPAAQTAALFTMLTAAIITSSKKVKQGKTGFKTETGLATLTLIAVASTTSLNPVTRPLIESVSLTLLTTATAAALLYIYGRKIVKPSVLLPVSAHMFDASTTVTALSQGLTEKSFLAKKLIQVTGPSGIFIVKTAVIIPSVIAADHYLDGEERRKALYLVTAVGLALGIRNLYLLSM